jgi:N6-L-threonylcarbamoyladenine synthase
MVILGIETSCDETALCVLEAKENTAEQKTEFTVLSNNILSQIALHREYGGVFPMMAKREHSKNLIPLLKRTLAEAGEKDLGFKIQNPDSERKIDTQKHSNVLKNIRMFLEREPELLEQSLEFIPSIEKPPIDAIAVTYGPGLEPALWVGLNFAKALSLVWNLPLVPINHMEGHVFVSLLAERGNAPNRFSIARPTFPALALLISGGHTELILARGWMRYKIIGETRDDAAGEAFDKVARILELPYPGGPEISALAEISRARTDASAKPPRDTESAPAVRLPRPMLHSDDYDFSFSGLKTAVLYMVKKLVALTDAAKQEIAREFEDAITEVLVSKTERAIAEFGVKTLILGGGVVANREIRRAFAELPKKYPWLALSVPKIDHATDNALMIAVAGYYRALAQPKNTPPAWEIRVQGNIKIGTSV